MIVVFTFPAISHAENKKKNNFLHFLCPVFQSKAPLTVHNLFKWKKKRKIKKDLFSSSDMPLTNPLFLLWQTKAIGPLFVFFWSDILYFPKFFAPEKYPLASFSRWHWHFSFFFWGVPAFSSLISSMLQMFPRKKKTLRLAEPGIRLLSGIGAHSLARARYIRTHSHFPNGGGSLAGKKEFHFWDFFSSVLGFGKEPQSCVVSWSGESGGCGRWRGGFGIRIQNKKWELGVRGRKWSNRRSSSSSSSSSSLAVPSLPECQVGKREEER